MTEISKQHFSNASANLIEAYSSMSVSKSSAESNNPSASVSPIETYSSKNSMAGYHHYQRIALNLSTNCFKFILARRPPLQRLLLSANHIFQTPI